ncbi:hypothetical protein StoSoilB5_21030 [Arthrobacter sp. StoSoilB5]|nr:hypothetical protein StoSoilB5_21030 [Arthrobacter sp. StoSoilB5]
MREEDTFGGFVNAWDVGHEPVSDVRDLVVGEELQDVLVARVVLGFEHAGPEAVGVLDRCRWRASQDGLQVVFDGGRILLLVGRRWESYPVGRFDGAAAVDEFGVEVTVFGGADRNPNAVTGRRVVRGVSGVGDVDAVTDGDTFLGEDAGEGRDGGPVRTCLSWPWNFGCVEGEDDAVRSFVGGEVGGYGAGKVHFVAWLFGEVYAEGGADFVFVEGDAHKAFLWPEAEGMADEAEQVGGVLDGKRIHCPVPFWLCTLLVAVGFVGRSDNQPEH